MYGKLQCTLYPTGTHTPTWDATVRTFDGIQSRVTLEMNEILGKDITQKELESKVRTMAKGKTPRPDMVVIEHYMHY